MIHPQWQFEQNNFMAGMAARHNDSRPFFNSLFNSVRKQHFFRSICDLKTKVKKKEVIKDFETQYSEQARMGAAYVEANRALLNADSRLSIGRNVHDSGDYSGLLKLSWNDESIKNWCSMMADKCSRMVREWEELAIIMIHGEIFLEQLENKIEFPCVYKYLCSGVVARVCDASWWRRKVRVLQARTVDDIARDFRMVHAKGQPYVSNEAVRLRRKQARRNRLTLEGFEAVNQEGQSFTLAELSDLSVSNPTNRRHELMTRISGFENLATQFNHQGLFITLTAPACFHPTRQYKNKKTGKVMRVAECKTYNGSTPRDAQEWLNKTWSLIRAKMHRQGVRVYGFRVAEPHGDGTPHWHFLLFCDPSFVLPIRSMFKNYSLRTNAAERGAAEYRTKFVLIDPARGSASGYIAKYISKSIDGQHICEDLMGNAGIEAAERICAWASTRGIRQFQQIGGGSVTVWRELRRLGDAEGLLDQAREAADSADWAAYCLLQGSGKVFFGRDEQTIRPAVWIEHEHDELTGEVLDKEFNKYGEPSMGKIFGVFCDGEYHLTRFFVWTVQRIGAAVKTIKKALPICTLSSDELLDLLRGDGSGSNNREAIALDLCQ